LYLLQDIFIRKPKQYIYIQIITYILEEPHDATHLMQLSVVQDPLPFSWSYRCLKCILCILCCHYLFREFCL